MNGQYPETPEEFVRWAAPKIQAIETTLVGTPDTESKGLVGQVKENEREVNRLKKQVWTGVGGAVVILALLGGTLVWQVF